MSNKRPQKSSAARQKNDYPLSLLTGECKTYVLHVKLCELNDLPEIIAGKYLQSHRLKMNDPKLSVWFIKENIIILKRIKKLYLNPKFFRAVSNKID